MTESTPAGPLPLDIDAALANPSAYFDRPEDVLAYPGMSKGFQLKLLRQWELDARLLAQAEGEGMGGGEESKLGRVQRVLRALEATLEESTGTSAATAPRHGRGNGVGRMRRAASPPRDNIAAFRSFMREQQIAGSLLVFAVGYLFGRAAVGRPRK